MPLYSTNFVVLIVFAIFWYRAADFEGAPAWLWTGLSLIISLAIWRWLSGGWLAMALGQAGLFVGIGIYRMRGRKP